MKFADKLNEIINKIGCNSKELSDYSNISQGTISRYRNGERTPKANSKQLENIVNALNKLAKEKNIKNFHITKNDLLKEAKYNYENFKNNLNELINTLEINAANMSKYIGFDASYLSKIKSGERKPNDIEKICDDITNYILANYKNDDRLTKLIKNNDLYNWILNNKNSEPIESFLFKLDEFDLNEYIKAIKFNDIKIPTLPIQLSKSKTYYGLEGFKNSQIDVLKMIVLSKQTSDVYFYSNMPMEEASKDLDFTKKFMFGIACILKKGQNLIMIHNLDRPFNEIMLGLEGWIPLYMTGQIKPFYFNDSNKYLYNNIDCVSSIAALSGNGINGNIHNSKYYVTNKKDEVAYYQNNFKLLLKKANPLMEIYTKENQNKFSSLISFKKSRNILSNLPIYTLSERLLNKILNDNNISNKEKEIVIDYYKRERKSFLNLLKKDTVYDEVCILKEKEFIHYSLPLSKLFLDKKIVYCYDDYLEHIKLTKELAKNNKNYHFKSYNNIFKNISIHIIDDKVVISKENLPYIHFVIHHPKLVDAIKNFKPQIIEKNT